MASFFCSYGQNDSLNIWGTYLNPEQPDLFLNICENNNWFFTTCMLCLIESPHNNEVKQSFEILHGTFESNNNNLEFRNRLGELIFLVQVVDTMNLKVIFAQQYLNPGEYFHRRSSFFEGHQCFSLMNDFFTRWVVFDLISEEDLKTYEILSFSKPGYIFLNDEYKVEYLDKGIFFIKSNQIKDFSE